VEAEEQALIEQHDDVWTSRSRQIHERIQAEVLEVQRGYLTTGNYLLQDFPAHGITQDTCHSSALPSLKALVPDEFLFACFIKPTGCATRWHFAQKCRNFINMQDMRFSPIAQHLFIQQQVSLSVPFPVPTRLRYFSLRSTMGRTLNELAKRLERNVYLVAHPVGKTGYF
jgi:hypothetical protein